MSPAACGSKQLLARSLVGSYITSLEMAGCSVTLLKIDDELLRFVVHHRAE